MKLQAATIGSGFCSSNLFLRVEIQVFNGKEYHRYKGERYFTRGTKKLHRVVWEFYNGKIPKGYHIHHKDENTANNDISNLEMLSCSEHLKLHALEHKENEQWLEKMRRNMQKANKAACKWHGSEEGRKWHSEHAKQQNIQPKEFVCEWCGKSFWAIPNGHNHFCSSKCKTAHRYHSGVDNEVRNCAECGKEFVANKYSSTKYCSRHCSGKVSARKRNEYRK